jgi:G:T/U-mismatch repair DNA glycosylase
MMQNNRISHRFLDRAIDPETQTLIIGTFNPEVDSNRAAFFYSRGRNYFWRLVPAAFGAGDMRKGTTEEKIQFIKRNKIDFIDLISEISVQKGEKIRHADDYIDARVTQWRNVIQEIGPLTDLKRVCFTRKTFSRISRSRDKIIEIQKYCARRSIVFSCVITPARFYSNAKQAEWNNFLNAHGTGGQSPLISGA